MADYTIDTDANVFGIDLSTPHPWICRDDDGDYWTVFKNLSNNIEIHKSEDEGQTWSNKKTLTDADFTGTPFPIDTFQIINLDSQDRVYVTLTKDDDIYGYIINTSTDVGSVDLDAVSLGMATAVKIEVRWDDYNTKLKIGYGKNNDKLVYLKTINLSGSFSDAESGDVTYGGNRGYGFCIDSGGNKFFNGMAISGGSLNCIENFSTGTLKGLGISNQIYDFANIICDYQDKIVLGCVYSDYLHIFKVSNDLSALEINNANYDLGFTPSSCFVTIDGLNDIYFIYTNSNDNESYYIKYDISESTWDSPIKLSLDNDGLLAVPELKAALNVSNLLVTYQSTS